MKKIDEKEIKGPDAFVQTADVVGKWFLQNKTPILGAVVLAIVAGVGYLTVDFYNKYKEARAAEAIFVVEAKIRDVEKVISERVSKEEDAEKEKLKDKKAPSKPPKDPLADIDFDKEFGSQAENLKQVILQHANTQVGIVAASGLAGLYSQFKQHQKAVELLSEMSKHLAEGGLTYGIIKTQLGTELTYLEKWDEALALFQDVLDHKPTDYLFGTVLVKMGVIYEQKNELSRAKDVYMRASTEFADSEAGKTARSYLRLLEYKESKSPAAKEGS